MNTSASARPKLRVLANHIGPIMELNADLSNSKQHLIFARNGTGKSFLARALRLLDPSTDESESEDQIPSLLVSEEAANGKGSFRLYEGDQCVGSIGLNARAGTVIRSEPAYIYHVFSEDFIEAHVRNRLHGLDGNISHEIVIGKENTEIDKKTKELEQHRSSSSTKMTELIEEFDNGKEKLKSDFRINASLGAYRQLNAGIFFSDQGYAPTVKDTPLGELQSQYNHFKSLPSDFERPVEIKVDDIFPHVAEISETLTRITSPSSVAKKFKDRIKQDTAFFVSGLNLVAGKSNCPFCTQKLGAVALEAIDAYDSFFKDEEAKHTRQLEEQAGQLTNMATTIKSRQTESLKAKSRFNNLKNYFPSFSEEIAYDLSLKLDKILEFISKLQENINTKITNLTAPIEVQAELDSTLYSTLINEANTNEKLFERIAKLSSDSKEERLKIQNDSCEAFLADFYGKHFTTITEVKNLLEAMDALEAEILDLQKTHGSSTQAKQRVVDTFQLMLRYFFTDIYTFDSATFSVRRKRKEIARGPDRTLSDGEKSVIAFCYYIARIHLRVNSLSDYEKVFLIIDDPVSSMSFDYIYRVAQALKYIRISGEGEIQISLDPQLIRPRMILLSHNSYFYNVVSANNVVKSEGLYQLISGESRHQMSNQKAFATPHMLQLRDVVEVSKGTKPPDHTTPNSIRSVVEGMWKFCRPDLQNFEDFVKFLISDYEIEIQSVLLNDLCHGGKFSDLPQREDEIVDASVEALKIVEKFAPGQLKSC